jgi:hypothetical protein
MVIGGPFYLTVVRMSLSGSSWILPLVGMVVVGGVLPLLAGVAAGVLAWRGAINGRLAWVWALAAGAPPVLIAALLLWLLAMPLPFLMVSGLGVATGRALQVRSVGWPALRPLAALAAPSVAGLAVAAGFTLQPLPAPPSEDELVAAFQEYRPDYQILVEMAANDPELVRVSQHQSVRRRRPGEPAGHSTFIRIGGVNEPLEPADGPDAYYRHSAALWFPAWIAGNPMHGAVRGYVQSATAPGPLVERLDEAGYPAYRALDGGWYLYQERLGPGAYKSWDPGSGDGGAMVVVDYRPALRPTPPDR